MSLEAYAFDGGDFRAVDTSPETASKIHSIDAVDESPRFAGASPRESESKRMEGSCVPTHVSFGGCVKSGFALTRPVGATNCGSQVL